MKSIICSFLLLTTFCLVPFVAFSSTFTSTNPIVLPTTTNHDFLLPEVLDTDGQPLKIGEEYNIISSTGMLGVGGVYLANISGTKCPDVVALHIVSLTDLGKPRPVKFFSYKQHAGVVHETEDINIMFSRPTSRPCVNETVWKTDYLPGLPNPTPGFVVTGGTLGNPGPENWFNIEKFEMNGLVAYKLRHYNLDVGVIHHDSGYHRLIVNEKPYPFRFEKFMLKDA